jgi:hypothetical protein
MSTIYPFDPTGTNPECRIAGEQHPVTAVNFKDFHFIVPNAAPFFEDSLQIAAKDAQGADIILQKNVHYYYSHEFIGASRACAKRVYGSITFLFNEFAGIVNLTYQTVGGVWTLDETEIAEIIANSLLNPRTTSWEQVAGYPTIFPVVDHAWNLTDMVGMTETVAAIDRIRDAILEGGESGLPAHLADKNNPHEVTKVQVGLGSVENFPLANQTQAEAGTNNTTYMTPLRVAQAIAILGPGGFTAHIANTSNPHSVTATQVGLGNVQNYGVATNAQAIAGTATNLYITPAGLKASLDNSTAGFSTHVTNTSNPHNVTATQVGLGNVQNYSMATLSEANAGSVNDKYMTPLRTSQAISQLALVPLSTHTTNVSNPHETTKLQVGLGSVDNYATATSVQAKDNTNTNTFMTPLRTYEAVMQHVGNDFVTHLNAANPHNVTKTTVGLGSVQNYPMASDGEATAATASDRYMSPRAVKLVVDSVFNTTVSAHIANTSNPHSVTKAQVGLSNVSNYATAVDADGVAGTATNLFMTPATTKAAANAVVNVHVANTSNPHSVTKAQVGLGNVDNFTSVTTAAGITTGSVAQFATAAAVKAYTDAAITTVNTALAGKLSTSGVAADSSKFGGKTYAEVLAEASSGGTFDATALKAEIKAVTADAYRIPSVTAIGGATDIWVKLGKLSLDPTIAGDGLTNIRSDLHWMVAGGELPSSGTGAMHYLHMTIHAPLNGDSEPIVAIERNLTEGSPHTGKFYYTWNVGTNTATIYLKAANGVNPITVTNLGKAGAVLETAAVVTTAPTSVRNFTSKAAARDSDRLGGQLPAYYALQSDYTTLLQAHNQLQQDFTEYQGTVSQELQNLADQINGG